MKRNYKRARRAGHREPAAEDAPRSPTCTPTASTSRVVPTGRTLIKGGIVLSLDPAIGDLPRGDVLIDGDRIVEVGPRPDGDRRRGDRRHRHDRDAGVRRHPPPHLGRLAAQHRHRRPARGPVELHLARAAQARAGVPARGRLHRRPGLGARRDRRRHHHAARLVAHPGLAGAHRRRRPGAQGLRPARGVRLRVPVVGQVGGAPAELVRAGGHRALLDEGPDAHARARGPRSGVHRLRGARATTGSWRARPAPASPPTSASAATAWTARCRRWARPGCSGPTPPTSTAPR